MLSPSSVMIDNIMVTSLTSRLSSLSEDLSLVVSESYEVGKQEWPQHIATFLGRF